MDRNICLFISWFFYLFICILIILILINYPNFYHIFFPLFVILLNTGVSEWILICSFLLLFSIVSWCLIPYLLYFVELKWAQVRAKTDKLFPYLHKKNPKRHSRGMQDTSEIKQPSMLTRLKVVKHIRNIAKWWGDRRSPWWTTLTTKSLVVSYINKEDPYGELHQWCRSPRGTI